MIKRKELKAQATARMYRHFAVVTLLITGALALATTDSAPASDDLSASRGKERKQLATLGRRAEGDGIRPPAATGWGPDNYSGGMGGGAGAASNVMPAEMRISSLTGDALEWLGLTREEFASLSPAQQQALLDRVRSASARMENPAWQQARRQQIEQATRASLRRSGGGSCSDC